jgi:hypothetical protein
MSESFETFAFSEWESALEIPSDLSDDGKGIHELKLSNKLYKSKEEVEKYCVDESFSDLQRALHILQ